MNTAHALKGLLLATAAAGMFATAGLSSAADKMGSNEGKIHCNGVNSCKGTGDCKGVNACQGQNSCKGKGFLFMTAEDCQAAQAKMEMEMHK